MSLDYPDRRKWLAYRESKQWDFIKDRDPRVWRLWWLSMYADGMKGSGSTYNVGRNKAKAASRRARALYKG